MPRKKNENSEAKIRNVTPKDYFVFFGEDEEKLTLRRFVDGETPAKKQAEAFLNETPEVLEASIHAIIVGKAKETKRQIRL